MSRTRRRWALGRHIDLWEARMRWLVVVVVVVVVVALAIYLPRKAFRAGRSMRKRLDKGE
ncbi:hypothetical protein [Asanoa siamensis]|nr:hypothetical protein [Asanoa siamensis]